MILTVKPVRSLKGQAQLPSSKSYTIRAFLVASCGGESTLINPSDCDDAKISMNIAKCLGAEIRYRKGNVWYVKSKGQKPQTSVMSVGESGTVLRLLLPMLARHPNYFLVQGEGNLAGRPNTHLVKTLRNMGVAIQGTAPQDSIPLNLKGGTLKGGRLEIDGSLSSQFISALLITCPQLTENTQLVITGDKIVSADYVVMTEQVLKLAGIQIQRLSDREFKISGNQQFKGLKEFAIPADYGLAAFLMAAAALVKSDIVLSGNLDDRFVQADGAILDLLAAMGVKFTKTSQAIKMQGPFVLKGGNFSLKNCPDLVPIVAVLALFAEGKTRLYDIAHARAKESDRISDLRKELLKVGARITEGDNELVIDPQPVYKKNIRLNPHHDHRLAMAFSVLGVRIGAIVEDIECTRKSYPRFVRDLKKIGGKMKKS
ncbi:MAG: 3-phosphoshikimate 1-carboxyvinyltransferase [Omnitrophica WOR_2 bacterium RIFCSPHIGHO2_01_FULL_48_9]|nr:MAG: 3-phosphoshikimate 1-carboxyvinyltransferase [Omnitrophica WOR_2 bacterium RIFCSPHIGHO2_02_FULL_48_11]OGX31187.1 MAG: 3-phosphoshikimate 1-carboxyvinyltransferase [Omnitrophica WOR_2 bacterium RIFCSPHIGHO2_01_FULL_48_9]